MMNKLILTFVALSGVSNGASLLLDFEPAGGTTAAGYQALQATNQDVSGSASGAYTAFGSTVTVTVSTANLPDGNLDFRSVTRDGGDKCYER